MQVSLIVQYNIKFKPYCHGLWDVQRQHLKVTQRTRFTSYGMEVFSREVEFPLAGFSLSLMLVIFCDGLLSILLMMIMMMCPQPWFWKVKDWS